MIEIGRNFVAVSANRRLVISVVCKSIHDIVESDAINENDREIFCALEAQRGDEANTIAALGGVPDAPCMLPYAGLRDRL